MRSAVTLAVAYLLLILQSTVLELAPMRMATPSLGLLVVLHVGLSSKWTISSAAVVAFVTGYLFDLVSGAPQGVHAFVFVLMAVCARLLTTRVAVQGIVLGAATSFVASLLASALVVIVRAQVAPEGSACSAGSTARWTARARAWASSADHARSGIRCDARSRAAEMGAPWR